MDTNLKLNIMCETKKSINPIFDDLFKSFGEIFNPISLKELQDIEAELENDEYYLKLRDDNSEKSLNYVAMTYKYAYVTKRLQLIINGLKKQL